MVLVSLTNVVIDSLVLRQLRASNQEFIPHLPRKLLLSLGPFNFLVVDEITAVFFLPLVCAFV